MAAPASSTRREEIIRVASGLLRERGLNVSLQDIADQLGTTYNALYHHFKSRDDLILHCLLRASSLLDDAMREAIEAGGSGLDQVLSFLRNVVASSLRERTPSGRLIIALSDDAQRVLGDAAAPLAANLTRLIEQGISDRSIRKIDPLVTTGWILHTIYWWPHELDADRPMEVAAETIIDLIQRALAA